MHKYYDFYLKAKVYVLLGEPQEVFLPVVIHAAFFCGKTCLFLE